jgi:hypothetical protein|uniref:hypothetical protein n=1 Tax=Cephaloticoccus sp. TaxID=1985742 RepID=UPI004049B680
MDWILDHLQIVIAAAAAVAYWLNQRREAQAEEDPPPGSNFEREEPGAAEEAERARRIREEIRRKIAERVGGGLPSSPQPVSPPPLFSPRQEVVVESRPTSGSADTAILERQRKLADQLEALKRQTPLQATNVSLDRPMPVGVARSSLMADLRGRSNLRRAMVVREVLGPPLGLR